jgi:1-acyl-sn-glycerol-3-phosphate acyltransferase
MVFGLVVFGWGVFVSMMSVFVTPTLLYLIPVWIVVGFIAGFLFMALITIFFTYVVFKHLSVTNAFKAYYTKSICWFAARILEGISIKVYGQGYIKGIKKMVYYSNHKSQADPVILLNVLPGPLGFTPKKELYKIGILKNYFNDIGCMLIDRQSDRETAKAMASTINNIKNGMSLLCFSEGGICTRDVEIMVNKKPGAYKFATKTGAPIVPIALIGTSKIHKKFPLFVPIKVQVHILKPLFKEDYEKMDTTQIAQYVYDEVNKKIESINGVKPLPDNIVIYR